MQAVIVALFAVLAVASAGVVNVHSVPVVHAAPAIVATPVVTKTIVPVAQSSSFSYRAPAAKLAVPVVHAAPVVPVVHAAPVVHSVVRTAPIVHAAPVVAHHGTVLVH